MNIAIYFLSGTNSILINLIRTYTATHVPLHLRIHMYIYIKTTLNDNNVNVKKHYGIYWKTAHYDVECFFRRWQSMEAPR
jgi:hypothetical protein